MITNAQFVSRVLNDFNTMNKDTHIPRRLVLQIGQEKTRTYIAQRWADRTLFDEEDLYAHVDCLEMEEVNSIECCDIVIERCRTLMRSKHKLPGLIYTRFGPAILQVTNLDKSIVFKPTTLLKINNDAKRMFGHIHSYNFYIDNDFLYIPNEHIEVISVIYITLDKETAEKRSMCTKIDNVYKEDCSSVWDRQFICPAKLYEIVVNETLKEIAGYRLQIPTDENPNLDSNIKTTYSTT